MRRNARKARRRTNDGGVDRETLARREVLAGMRKMSAEELFALAVRAGIYTEDGKLTPPYRDDAEPSGCRPTD